MILLELIELIAFLGLCVSIVGAVLSSFQTANIEKNIKKGGKQK